MKNIVILGAGTSGTIMANLLNKKLAKLNCALTIIDQVKVHYYQPGFLFLPFDNYPEQDLIKDIKKLLPENINYINKKIEKVYPTENKVLLNDEVIYYDALVIATGCNIFPDDITGMKGPNWYKNIFDFYTYEGAKRLRHKLRNFKGGKLVIQICEMPIRYAYAPYEFAFLANDYFKNKGIRNKVEIVVATPLPYAFPKTKISNKFEKLLKGKNINFITDFHISEVDNDNNIIKGYSHSSIYFDLLVTIPPNKGDAFVERSGLGDYLNYIPTNKSTLQSQGYKNIFVIGDASNILIKKSNSVIYNEAKILLKNIIYFLKNKPIKATFNGYSNALIDIGNKKTISINSNYTHEIIGSKIPISKFESVKLFPKNKKYHPSTLNFKSIYWQYLIKGISIHRFFKKQ